VSVRILVGDAVEQLRLLQAGSVQMCICSPPYFALRSYLDADHADKGKEIGSEPTPDAFVQTMVDVFREVKRCLRPDGCLVLNLGDSYSGSGKGGYSSTGIVGDHTRRQGFDGDTRYRSSTLADGRVAKNDGYKLGDRVKPDVDKNPAGIPSKNLLMIPFRVALALQADGWVLRSVMPWVKRNSMPESVVDRPASAIEYLFLLAKSERYFWDAEAIRKEALQPTGEPRRTGQHKANVLGGIYADTATSTLGTNQGSAGRSYRNSDPFFATWQGLMLDEAGDPLALVVNPKPNPLAHFASFPPDLVEPFVKAGTSERGACPACGAGWRRVVERGASRYSEVMAGRSWRDVDESAFERGIVPRRGEGGHTRLPGGQSAGDLTPKPATHLGWQPSCACPPGDPVPCVVLDCFAGTGTSGLVAERLGRDSILIELSSAYAEMASARIYGDAPMFARVEVG
jgi:DNA modification methylase